VAFGWAVAAGVGVVAARIEADLLGALVAATASIALARAADLAVASFHKSLTRLDADVREPAIRRWNSSGWSPDARRASRYPRPAQASWVIRGHSHRKEHRHVGRAGT
jgi:hypothetical protein